MWKLAALMEMLLATVFAGVAVIVITSMPSLYDQAMKLILPSVLVAAVIAIFPSIWIAKKIIAETSGK